nr:DUF6461 domain-containing protein [Actinoplanes awajinensis]
MSGCAPSEAALPLRDDDDGYRWASPSGPLGRGFCLTLVRGRRPSQVVPVIGGKSFEWVDWAQLVGPGDGEEGGSRYFAGIAYLGDWTVILEDRGGLGMDGLIAGPLSAGTEVVAYQCGADRHAHTRIYRDGRIELDQNTAEQGADVTDPTEAAITFVESQVGFKLTGALLESKRYLLVTVPKT